MTATTVPPPLVLVTVGTDHHPFNRLVEWADRWLINAEQSVRCQVQYGTSRPPHVADGQPKFAHAELQQLVAEAHVVVCHGGPGTIMDCRQAGLTPIVVPRRHGLGEHVDDHQVAFAGRFAELGFIQLAEHEVRLRELIDSALSEPRPLLPSAGAVNADTVVRFAEKVAELGPRRPRGWRPRRR